QIVMQAAALGPLQSAVDDEFGSGGDVAQFQQIARDDEVPVILLNLFLQMGDAASGALEPFVGSYDAHVIPHQPPNLVPLVRDDDQFIGIVSFAGGPGGYGCFAG